MTKKVVHNGSYAISVGAASHPRVLCEGQAEKDLVFRWKGLRAETVIQVKLGEVGSGKSAYIGRLWEKGTIIRVPHHGRASRGDVPPKGALIDWLTPPDYADDRIHALLTGYDRWVRKYGHRAARHIFLVQSIGVVFGFWAYWLQKRVELLKLLRLS